MPSVFIAKQRLESMLDSDRVNCTPDKMNKIKKDLFHTLSKHMELSWDEFHVQITRNEIHIILQEK